MLHKIDGIAFLGTVGNRVNIRQALPLGERLLAQVRAMPGVTMAELCGSIRRRRETSKDIDIVAAAADAGPVMAAFTALPEVMKVIGHGETKSSIVAKMIVDGEQVVLNADLRVVAEQQFPFAIAWASSQDGAGAIVAKAYGLNAALLQGTIDNTEMYRLMYGTLFGSLPPRSGSNP